MNEVRYFVLPDPNSKCSNICLLALGQNDYVCRFSKDPLYFQAESKLAHIIKNKEENIRLELERSASVDVFCQRLLTMVSKVVNISTIKKYQPQSAFYKSVLDEIKLIGWEIITEIDSTLSFFEVTIHDESKREITIRFDIVDDSFPNAPPKVTSNLPLPVNFEWNSQVFHLIEIIELHKNALPMYAPLWNQLADIDQNAFVIEPREPSLACCMRRIVISSTVQMQFEVNPKRPQYIPKISFIGSEKESRAFMTTFNTNSFLWSFDKTLRQNFEKLLEIELPKKDAKELEDTSFDCAICYLERLGAELPDVVCKCSKRFHRSCLVEWLRHIPGTEQGLQEIFGKCPYCSNPIQCAVTSAH